MSDRSIVPSVLRYIVGVAAPRRALAIVERGRLAVGRSHDHEPAAAEVPGARVRDGEGERRGDGGIDGVATARSTDAPTSDAMPRDGHDDAAPRRDDAGVARRADALADG